MATFTLAKDCACKIEKRFYAAGFQTVFCHFGGGVCEKEQQFQKLFCCQAIFIKFREAPVDSFGCVLDLGEVTPDGVVCVWSTYCYAT